MTDPSASLTVTVEIGADGQRRTLTAVLAGEMDVATAHLPYEAVTSAMADEPGGTDVRLDLSAVRFVDSVGLGALVRIHQEVAARDGTVTLRGVGRRLQNLLAMTGLDRDLRIESA